MNRKFALPFLLIFLFSTFLIPATPARADGIIICDPGPCLPGPMPMAQLAIKYHHVTVTIQDQIAITHVDQVFYNPNDWQIEGTYLFPLPVDAVVTNFTLWVDGKPVEGQVLSADEARQKYQQIVSTLRDPALLEYSGRGAVQAHIFPIPPKGERRVELEYTQTLTADNGLVRYVYPLNTEKFSALPLESVSISVDVRANVPIRAVYSPTHDVGVNRDGEFHVTAGYEATNVTPNTDFAIYYSLGETEAFHLLTYRNPGDTDPDGFFLLLLAPSPQAAVQPFPKDVILVLDHSGSMEGEKFQQAQEALRYILQHLNPEDRFNLITFSTSVETYAPRLRPANEVAQALTWVDQLSALGSTDINRALLEAAAMADRERPTYVIFLTDGLPTTGEIDSQKIISNLKAAAPSSLRLFVFGVGYDVDTVLLDSLAQDHHGTSTYVRPGEHLDEIISGFYAKISTPVLTDLSLDFGNISTYDLYPSPLPDLFIGSQIIAVGRYRDGGSATVTLTGQINNQAQTFTFPNQAFSQQSESTNLQSTIPRLWATRKIGYLLNEINLHGPNQEIIDQVVKLSIRYGIVTPYTSYLVTENAPLGAAAQERIAGEQYSQQKAAPAPVSGEGAVNKAADIGGMGGADVASAPSAADASRIKIVGTRTFLLSQGVWTDTTFDPEKMTTVKVAFLSDDYFKLVNARPDLAAAFALGQKVIVLSEGVAYESVDTGTPTAPITIPPAPTVNPRVENTPLPSPTSPRPISTPVPTQPKAPGQAPCGSALLPLAAGLLWLGTRKRRA